MKKLLLTLTLPLTLIACSSGGGGTGQSGGALASGNPPVLGGACPFLRGHYTMPMQIRDSNTGEMVGGSTGFGIDTRQDGSTYSYGSDGIFLIADGKPREISGDDGKSYRVTMTCNMNTVTSKIEELGSGTTSSHRIIALNETQIRIEDSKNSEMMNGVYTKDNDDPNFSGTATATSTDTFTETEVER